MGMDTAAHWNAMAGGNTGIRRHNIPTLSTTPFMGSLLDDETLRQVKEFTAADTSLSTFERLAAYSARRAMENAAQQIDLSDTVLILSTTKGNIELLGTAADEAITLHHSAHRVAAYLGITHRPVVISHACVSGVIALQYARRLLLSGRYKHAIVTGADRFSRFVLSGFQSFQAVSDEACRPFDEARKGITLGEAAATIILSAEADGSQCAQLVGGATSNDANHISGPSRTGAELADAIKRALLMAGIQPADIDMISAHGTATPYNDEMEAKAFHLAGVAHAAVHSFKGYTGHTLGAAGILESAMALEALRRQTLIPSIGFERSGVSCALHVTTAAQPAPINHILKTASGFGGSNAAIVWKK
jgi:3-oxoacyl-[acyl-carrier-protein] synthase I